VPQARRDDAFQLGAPEASSRSTSSRVSVSGCLAAYAPPCIDGDQATRTSTRPGSLKAVLQLAEHRAEPAVLAAPAELPSQRVIVQHRVPRELLDMVKSQFDVMNTWLEPLLAASEGQRRDLNQLQNAVQTCFANYEGLRQQLESAQARGNA